MGNDFAFNPMSALLPAEEDEEFDGPLMVGYHLRVPPGPASVSTEVGPRPEGPTARRDRHEAWQLALGSVARRFHPSARVVAQDESTDAMGSPAWWVIVWMDVAGDDVWSGREHLEIEGYHVSSISVHYDPAMA